MFISFNNKIINSDSIEWIDLSNLIDKGYVKIYCKGLSGEIVDGPEAFNVVMDLCPNSLEGKQAKYHKNAWALHNLLGHPLMQIFSMLHLTSLGIKIHDMTVPNPKVLDEQ